MTEEVKFCWSWQRSGFVYDSLSELIYENIDCLKPMMYVERGEVCELNKAKIGEYFDFEELIEKIDDVVSDASWGRSRKFRTEENKRMESAMDFVVGFIDEFYKGTESVKNIEQYMLIREDFNEEQLAIIRARMKAKGIDW